MLEMHRTFYAIPRRHLDCEAGSAAGLVYSTVVSDSREPDPDPHGPASQSRDPRYGEPGEEREREAGWRSML